MKKLYLYLARRDKKGIKLLTVLKGNQTVNSEVKELKSLNLPITWQKEIEQAVFNNKMLYEPRIESADSFQDLKERLKMRGYTQLPIGAVQMLNLGGFRKAPVANTSSCEVKKTMMRKQGK